MGIDAQMFCRSKTILTPEAVRHRAYRLAQAFGHDEFFISRPGESSFSPKGRHCLEIIKVYEQDGPDIVPSKGEQFIQCHMWSRYYGPGYERGNITLICAVAEWLEANIPGAEVWYGGDSSGVCAQLFDAAARANHKKLLYEVGETWFSGMGAALSDGHIPPCTFCRAPMTQKSFWNAGPEKFICHGCGDMRMREQGGKFRELDEQEKKEAKL